MELDLCVVAYEVDAVVGGSVALCGERGSCSDDILCDKAMKGGSDCFVCAAETRQYVRGSPLLIWLSG